MTPVTSIAPAHARTLSSRKRVPRNDLCASTGSTCSIVLIQAFPCRAGYHSLPIGEYMAKRVKVRGRAQGIAPTMNDESMGDLSVSSSCQESFFSLFRLAAQML